MTHVKLTTIHYRIPGTQSDAYCLGRETWNTSDDPRRVTCPNCFSRAVSKKTPDREWLIAQMRKNGVSDAITGRVLGITRERVRQLGGNITEDPEAVRVGTTPIDVEKFIEDVRSGEWSVTILAKRHGFHSITTARKAIEKLGLTDEYIQAKRDARHNKLKARLRRFAELWREKNGTHEFCTNDLVAYDASLYTLCCRAGFLVEWSRELGLVYTTGEQKRKNGRVRDGEDMETEKAFERRRRMAG